jgi:hypothetical protein
MHRQENTRSVLYMVYGSRYARMIHRGESRTASGFRELFAPSIRAQQIEDIAASLRIIFCHGGQNYKMFCKEKYAFIHARSDAQPRIEFVDLLIDEDHRMLHTRR